MDDLTLIKKYAGNVRDAAELIQRIEAVLGTDTDPTDKYNDAVSDLIGMGR